MARIGRAFPAPAIIGRVPRVTPLYGFDFHDPAKKLEFGNVSGTIVDLGLATGVAVTWTVHDPDAMATVLCSGSGTSNATTALLARFEHAALTGVRYAVVFQSTDALATRKIVSIIMLATLP